MHYTLRDITLHLAALLDFLLGIFVLCKNYKSSRHIAFFLSSLAVGLWSLEVDYFLVVTSLKSAYFWIHTVAITITLIAVTFYHLTLTFTYGNIKDYKNKLLLAYSLAAGVFIGYIFPNFYIKDIIVHPWGKQNILGIGYYIVYLIYGVYIFLAFRNLITGYRYGSGTKKDQIKYLIYSTLFALIWGTYFNWLLVLFGNYKYIWVGPYCSFIWIPATFYAIVRHRLLDIDTVIHKTILWVLTIIILIIPIGFIHNILKWWMANLNAAWLISIDTLMLVVFLGYYHRLKPKIDHFFRRRKYDYYSVLSGIGEKIGTELDINSVIDRLLKELNEVLYIRNGLVLVREPGQEDYKAIGSLGYELSPENKYKLAISGSGMTSQWLRQHQKALEREQVEIDPQYGKIKEEALPWLTNNMVEVLIPVVIKNSVNALVGIGKKENLQVYTITDIELLERMGRQIGITIDNALHHEDIIEKERLEEELRLGREIQQNLLPRKVPPVEGLRLEGLMLPAKEIGGDYYDYIQSAHQEGKTRLGIVIGDVSGKGVAAGLIMATAKATLKGLSQQGLSPSQILAQANSILFEYTNGQKFMTMLYLEYNGADQTLTYSSAGHEHILIYEYDTQTVESILSGGFMLGMMPSIEHFLENHHIHLKLQDKIILYTDGVTEARNSKGEFFGLPKLIEIISKYGRKTADELLHSIKDEVYVFMGTQEQYDDITLVVIEKV